MQTPVPSTLGRSRLVGIAVLMAGILAAASVAQDAPHNAATFSESEELPVDSDTYRRAREALTAEFVEYQSKRFVVLSDAPSAWARKQLELLERTHHQFQRFVTRLNIPADPLRHKQVCVLFAQRPAYEAFAQQQDGISNRWISGYYSPRQDWIVFYNVHQSPLVEQARYDIEEARRESLRSSTGLRSIAGHDRKLLDQQRQSLDEFAEREAIATTIHECAHQLFFHTGVQASHVQYPLWICEGLATCFETKNPQQAFGPDVDYPPRRERFDAILEKGKLISLRELIGINSIGDETDEQRVQAIYHQSYALVAWLTRYRRDALRQYLLTMREQPAGRVESQRHVELFAQSFGNIETLERTWLRHERTRAGISNKPKLVQSPTDAP